MNYLLGGGDEIPIGDDGRGKGGLGGIIGGCCIGTPGGIGGGIGPIPGDGIPCGGIIGFGWRIGICGGGIIGPGGCRYI